jgi:hypothetical protein
MQRMVFESAIQCQKSPKTLHYFNHAATELETKIIVNSASLFRSQLSDRSEVKLQLGPR